MISIRSTEKGHVSILSPHYYITTVSLENPMSLNGLLGNNMSDTILLVLLGI